MYRDGTDSPHRRDVQGVRNYRDRARQARRTPSRGAGTLADTSPHGNEATRSRSAALQDYKVHFMARGKRVAKASRGQTATSQPPAREVRQQTASATPPPADLNPNERSDSDVEAVFELDRHLRAAIKAVQLGGVRSASPRTSLSSPSWRTPKSGSPSTRKTKATASSRGTGPRPPRNLVRKARAPEQGPRSTDRRAFVSFSLPSVRRFEPETCRGSLRARTRPWRHSNS